MARWEDFSVNIVIGIIFFFFSFLKGFKYSYLILIIYIQLYGLEYCFNQITLWEITKTEVVNEM